MSFGAPLLVAGDELGRTQRGNNNPYSQDNEISWVDWSDTDTALLDFARRAIAVRRRHPVLRRRRYLTGAEAGEIEWFTPAGAPMTGPDWDDPNARCLTVYLDGSDAPDRDEDGNLLQDDDLLLLVNGWSESDRLRHPRHAARRIVDRRARQRGAGTFQFDRRAADRRRGGHGSRLHADPHARRRARLIN